MSKIDNDVLCSKGLSSNAYKYWLKSSQLPKQDPKPISRKSANQINYADWLESMQWDFYCTFTTNYELTLKSARRLMGRLHRKLETNHSGSTFFWVAEPFDCKEGFHTHGLLRFDDRDYKNTSVTDGRSLDFELLRKSWLKVNPQSSNCYATLERFQPSRGATSYVGKYMNKYRSDYDLLISNNGNTKTSWNL